MGKVWRQYSHGLSQLLGKLGQDHPSYTEAWILQQRLLENLARARLYGDTDTTRAERTQILGGLDRLALAAVGVKFSALFPAQFGPFIRDTSGTAYFVPVAPLIIGGPSAPEQVLETASDADSFDQDTLYQVIEAYEQIIADAHESGKRQVELIYLQDLGQFLLRSTGIGAEQRQALLSQATNVLQQALRLSDTIDAAPLLRARIRYYLARCYHQLGRRREAIALLEQARETFSRHKARPELARALLELGQLYHLTQDFESAHLYLKDALRLFQRLGDTDGTTMTQEALGSLALQTARPSEAIDSLREARRGYTALRRDERIQAVDELLRMANQAVQSVRG